MKFVFGWVEKIMGKGENAGYQYFLLFPSCSQKASSTGSLKVVTVLYRVNFLPHHQILDSYDFKEFADDILNLSKKSDSIFRQNKNC